MELFYEYMVIFFNLSPTSSHLYPLQVENCNSNSRLVVDVDDNGKFRPEMVNVMPQLPLLPLLHNIKPELYQRMLFAGFVNNFMLLGSVSLSTVIVFHFIF